MADVTPTERVAQITLALARGETLTTAAVAERVELSHSGAWRLMCRLALALPVYQDDVTGTWRLMSWVDVGDDWRLLGDSVSNGDQDDGDSKADKTGQ